ncbi:hypothetical protein K2X14_09970 [Acetobacter sp. TBRC 12305]|uniref:Uncharacterized protein n=1 Tax=Acetobacter garciniae TaxID=2817435 RepID=A0A939KNV0_9PROT|nr:hypothetical protein [Acetobacter garciniae]MBO1326095.1 hypothetical protein [Acetobacter garciniae]MBX0345160.1 hypothetical protein [Acetobacter garciniae]
MRVFRKGKAINPFSVGDTVRIHTGWPYNYDLDYIGVIEDIKLDAGPEDDGLAPDEVHRFGIALPHGGIYYFCAKEIRKVK